jgi:hypothetical protein
MSKKKRRDILFVTRSIYVVGLYWFIQVVDFKVFGKVLINEQSTSTAANEGFDGLFTRANINRNIDQIPRNVGYGYRVYIEIRRY